MKIKNVKNKISVTKDGRCICFTKEEIRELADFVRWSGPPRELSQKTIDSVMNDPKTPEWAKEGKLNMMRALS